MQILPKAFSLHTNYQRNRKGLETSMSRLASGDRFAEPGVEPASQLSISQRFRHQIRRAEASTTGLQTAMSYLDSTDAYADEVTSILNRMMEIAASSSQDLMVNADRTSYQREFAELQRDLTSMSRNSRFAGMQQTGRDVISSFDGNTNEFRFWRENGDGGDSITRDFSTYSKDARGTLIGFDSSEDYSMSRDGNTLYYLANVAGDGVGTVRMKAYDIENNRVTVGTDLFASGDTLFVNEDGQLHINGAGTLYTVAEDNLARSATALANLSASTDFSIYKGEAYYYRSSDSHLVKANTVTAAATDLVDPAGFAAGDHTFAASGKYAAEESVAGSIRVIDTRTGTEATIAIGVGADVTNMHFSESGDRIYYVNQTSNSIDYVDVSTDSSNNVQLSYGGKAVQGINANSFEGLDLGGANPTSERSFALAADSVQDLKYQAIELDLYALGLANTRVNSLADANSALEELKEASNRATAARAQIRAKASRFSFVIEGHRKWTANMANAESQIRDVDIARESATYANFQMRQQASQAMLVQFNSLSQNILRLLQ